MNACGRWIIRLGLILLTAACLLGSDGAGPARAQNELIRVDAKGPVYIRADQVEYNEKSQTYTIQGEVEISRGSTRLMADKVLLNSQTLTAEAEGRARLTFPGQVITGRSIIVDLQAGSGKIYQGQVFVESSHYYLRGREIEKTGRDTYRLRGGAFTTCDGSDPAWQLTSEEMEVTMEGYGVAKSTAFRVKNIPVLWTPYLIFPAKFKRQSGLLAPQAGSTKRDGFVFSQPYFQTLGEDQDLTFTVNYMSKRGVGLGLEYRYNLAPGSKGILMADYLHKDRRARELYDQGDLAEPYNSRYWIRGMVDQNLFGGAMKLTADLDMVSDQDYLREFDFGNTGFYASNQRLLRWFGRELEPRTSLLRENKVNLQRTWSNAAFNGTVTYWDDLSTDNKTTLQQLPKLTLDATRQPVGDTGLYFQMASTYLYNYREEGAKGHVADVNPTMALPLNFNDYLYLEPSITYRGRFFNVDAADNEDPNLTTEGFNQLWQARVDASTYMFRVFNFGTPSDPFAIKHGVRPYISWSYQPDMGDDDVAEMARISQGRSNVFSYGVRNSFTSKTISQDEKTGEMRPHYREFLRLNFSHQFDLKEYRQDRENGRYWGDLAARLELDLGKHLYTEAESKWNLYNNRFQEFNWQVIAKDWRGDSINVDYRQTHGGVHQINTKLTLALNEEWSLAYYNRKDLKEEIDFEQRYEIRYMGQCWGIRLFYVDTHYRQQGYWVVFSLGGFGELFGYGRIEQESMESE